MQDSARSTNVRKFQDDAETLLQALRQESDPFLISRYKFYLAQGFRDFGDCGSALKYYLERAELGFWHEEVFQSLHNAAQMKVALKHPETEIIETYLRAHCLSLLADGQVPEDQQTRIRQNAHFAVEKIGPPANDDRRGRQAPAIADTRLPSLHTMQMSARRAAATDRYAIVTPYFIETREKLERGFRSVRRQTVAVDHIVVADGFAQQWIDGEPVRHFRLDMPHHDFGGTPRGLGALLAASEGYRGIGFLDADNWIADDHVERCVEAASRVGDDCDYVIAKRFLTRLDGTTINVKNPDLLQDTDTNCLFFLEGSYHALHHWVTIPRPLSPINDRLVAAALQNYGLRPASVKEATRIIPR